LDTYPNQIEIVSAEQMLDMYASGGLPRMYKHWSFGKRFMHQEGLYRKGLPMAYELVINSVPCINYCMEQNTMAMQALVMAHAAFGHNHFFKNNYLFRTRTDAESVLDYLGFARNYIRMCEEKYGEREVEKLLDAAHALSVYGVFRYERPHILTKKEREDREQKARMYREGSFDLIMATTIPNQKNQFWKSLETDPTIAARLKKKMRLPEDNLLYFIEKHAPRLEEWQREIIHIVRYIAEYFYPQKQTKMMNEGCATFVHYYIMNALYRKGCISEGAMLEVIDSHTNVIRQLNFDDPHYHDFNPYNLGWNMMRDIARIATGYENWTIDPKEEGSRKCNREQLAEDREWFPDIALCGDWRSALKYAWANFRDESFILQYVSPRFMREKRMFLIRNDTKEPHVLVRDIADERGYRNVRQALARQHDINLFEPPIEVSDTDLLGDRTLYLRHKANDFIPLHEADRNATLEYVRYLWGYQTRIESIGPKNDELLSAFTIE